MTAINIGHNTISYTSKGDECPQFSLYTLAGLATIFEFHAGSNKRLWLVCQLRFFVDYIGKLLLL